MKRKIRLTNHERMGIVCPRPEFRMEVLTTLGFQQMKFVLDTGSDITTIPLESANRFRLPFNRSAQPITVQGIGGRTQGSLDQVTIRLFGVVRTIPCVFAETSPAQETRSSRPPLNLLGRAGFLTDCCDIRINDSYLILTNRSGLPKWAHRLVERFYPVWRETKPTEPI